MQKLEILHFEQLKNEIQAQYLTDHTPSQDDISKWKGIDIIYFQEDLRKKAKGNISEKTFYTYFKTSPVSKLPRIDMLNILSIYAGYTSWYDFKKNHLFADEILEKSQAEHDSQFAEQEKSEQTSDTALNGQKKVESAPEISPETIVLQKTDTDNELVIEISTENNHAEKAVEKQPQAQKKNYVWGVLAVAAATVAAIFGFGSELFLNKYTYCFVDADRNANVHSSLDIKVIKDNESPIYYRINPGECFTYGTKEKTLRMEISSPLYENLTLNRNLEDAPEEERIQLKPDDYKTAVYYFSRKDVSGNPELIKQKRRELEQRISDNATILQLFENDVYGIETLDKQKYITLVTTPTTSLKNLSVIEMKREKGKIVSIKFKIKDDGE